MYIRTEIGSIGYKIKEDENFNYYSNGYILDKGDMKSWWIDEREDNGQCGFGAYKELSHIQGHGKDFVKSQGETIIDVLEVGDVVINISYRISKGVVTSKSQTTINTRNTVWYKKDITKVITHEQYMPLAQEVK